MLRIVALNEEVQNVENNEDEIQVTKEAEETIAVSEYMRALSLKSKGKNEIALKLFQELLETRVLNEISLDDKTDTLFCVRYNCHKNIALIYEEKENYDLALQHYIDAMDLDDTEVYIMNRLGQLALKLKNWSLAQHAFEKCLAKNPNHWPAADGILQVLCLNENILGAYGWAMKWYSKDQNYKRSIQVLLEITEKFECIIPFLETVYKCSFKPSKSLIEKYKKEEGSVFPIYDKSIEDIIERPVKPDISEFRQDKLNWLTVGKFITSVYNYCKENKHCLVFLLTMEDIAQINQDEENDIQNGDDVEMLEENKTTESEINSKEGIQSDENETTEKFIAPSIDLSNSSTKISNGNGSQLNQIQSDSNAEDSDNPKSETDQPAKPKSRRRCSDLSFLEQWGWHKNRRYSSRKKSQQDQKEIDTTLNGFLKRIFSKFFEENFDDEPPFPADVQNDCSLLKNERVKEEKDITNISFDDFQRQHEEDFQIFLKELQSENFDLIRIIFLWLKYISKYWEEPITEEMKKLYHTIYEFYLNHYDLVTWNQLSNDDFNASFRMAMFFLELDYEKAISETKGQNKNEVSPTWKMLFHHLKFNSGCAYVLSDDIYEKNIIRLMWLDYLSAKFEHDLNRSVDCLKFVETLINKQQEGFILYLPNLHSNNTIKMDLVKNIRIDLQRKISLNNVKNLYGLKKFSDLVEILKDSLINSTEIKHSDNTVMKIQTQFEVLLESLWNLEKYEECLIWSERCLKYAVQNLLSAPADTYRYKEWAETINFILIYIEELILVQTYEILSCLEKYLSRLVQSLSKILVHQLDAPFDKNNNPTHPVNIKRPWIILHQILLRIEDQSPVIIKQKTAEAITEIEDIEEILPHTILVLFTAHEFLGKRQWCTRDNGQLLLYTLANVAPKFRAPFMDGYRDLVGEYLEQTTYCLYGYPPKKARSRHIEEHDAAQVELTWTRAIQLFDLYRPENLPEFNSYKLDSISYDMEQLLLKILPLIPKENDPTPLTSNIKDFITGKVDELPQECQLLPHRTKCLYYLLADYYFKSRDFSKTIKFYILDLTCEPTRFDSWAGLALSKASRLETRLNSCVDIDVDEFLLQTEEAERCFEQCIKLNKEHKILWIEYGSFAYIVNSFCSRNLKHSTDTFSMEKFAFVESHKERFLNTAQSCFMYADKSIKMHQEENVNEDGESHDETWLFHYMLGKIAEKRKAHPKVYLDYYIKAASLLYESNATYPIKINHNSPSTLSIEALEIFYRTTSAIIKYLEQHNVVEREIGRLFSRTLKDLANSPFAYNQAKIDDNSINALKRKLAEKAEMNKSKQAKIETNSNGKNINEETEKSSEGTTEKIKSENAEPVLQIITAPPPPRRSLTPNNVTESKLTSPSRRGSQESTVTTVTSTTTTTGTGTSSSTSSSSDSDDSSSDSSSSDSESGSDDSDDEKPDENTPLSESELEIIYKDCVRNLEECVTRFPEHYKSVYRLVNHYANGPAKLQSLEKCKQLLFGTYTTGLGNQIVGLFFDRKNSNFFNGIWKIPSSEIDRPGNFSSHLVKCTHIFLEILRKLKEHKILIDVALQLHRTPENDKRYIKDGERLELFQQAMTFCAQVMRDILKENMQKRDDVELINLMIDVYKVHKKCIKHMNEKETIFSQLLVDVYKYFIEDKVAKIPDSASLLDSGIRFCSQEISSRKNQQKYQLPAFQTSNVFTTTNAETISISKPVNTTTTAATYMNTKPIPIPGVPRPRGRPVGSKNAPSNPPPSLMNIPNFTSLLDSNSMASLISLYSNPALSSNQHFQKLVAEYYKLFASSSFLSGNSSNFSNLIPPPPPSSSSSSSAAAAATAAAMSNPFLNLFSQAPPTVPKQQQSQVTAPPNIPQSTTISPVISKPSAVPQFDIKNLIASAASQVAKSTNISQSPSATINVGTGQLTISPTTSKSSIPSSNISPQNTSKSSGISVTKVPSSTPSLAVKPLSELIGTPSTSSIPNLPDLPKSLTITPTSFLSEASKQFPQMPPQISLFPEGGSDASKSYAGGKIKNVKKSKISSFPYNITKSQAPQQQQQLSTSLPSMSSTSSSFMAGLPTAAQLNNLASLAAQQFSPVNSVSTPNLNQQAALLNSYAEIFKSMGINPALFNQSLNLPQFQMPQQKRPYTKRPRTSKTQTRFPNPLMMQQQEMMTSSSIGLSTSSNTGLFTSSKSQKSSGFPLQQPFNMPISRSPLLSPSPNPALSPILTSSNLPPPSLQSVTPPLLSHTSPTKTLQQKLAERQKANALNESSSTKANLQNISNTQQQLSQSKTKKKDAVDVIVLD